MTRGVRWLTRPVLAWTLFDVASSTYAALVPTFFGLYFVAVVASDLSNATAYWGATASLALALAGGLAPFVGALADQRGRWLGLLASAALLCVVATASMPLVSRGAPAAAAALFIAAQVGYAVAMAIYDSLLLRVTGRTHFGRVSAFGWTVGFGGGIIALLAALAVMRGVPIESQAERLKDVFGLTALLFALFAVPGLLGLRRLARASVDHHAPPPSARAAYRSVIETLRQWRRHREVFRFLCAYYLINDVLVTILFFIAIILRGRFGLTIEDLLWLALLYHVLASPATLAFGYVADRWGQPRAVYAMIAILCVALLLLALGTSPFTPVAVVVLLGSVYGSLQAVCRSLFALLVPVGKSAELFGFHAIAGRLSAALGPLTFSAISVATGNETAALLALLVFLLAAAAVLCLLRMPAAEDIASPATQ